MSVIVITVNIMSTISCYNAVSNSSNCEKQFEVLMSWSLSVMFKQL